MASVPRAFNALCERRGCYKPFHNRLAKRGFAHFTRLINELACSVLRFTPDSAFARFKQIRIQDGTSFAVKPTLAGTFLGRFTTVSPAAVELHVSLESPEKLVDELLLAPNIAEGLIWASLCAATLKRHCAHATQGIARVAMSTRIVAKCIHHVLADILYDLMHGPGLLRSSVERAIGYLAANAQRAKPERDRKTGRGKLGLVHVGVPA